MAHSQNLCALELCAHSSEVNLGASSQMAARDKDSSWLQAWLSPRINCLQGLLSPASSLSASQQPITRPSDYCKPVFLLLQPSWHLTEPSLSALCKEMILQRLELTWEGKVSTTSLSKGLQTQGCRMQEDTNELLPIRVYVLFWWWTKVPLKS